MVAWRYALKKVKKYGDFDAHAFVKYTNNLCTSKMLEPYNRNNAAFANIYNYPQNNHKLKPLQSPYWPQ